MLRPGSVGSKTAADHLRLLREAIGALPPALRRKLMITCDGAGASHELVKELDRLASRHGCQLTYSVGWALGAREKAAIGKVPETAWEIAVDGKGEVRERRADGACAGRRCAHRAAARGAGRQPAHGLAQGDAGLRPPRAAAPRRVAVPVRGRRRLAYSLWVTNLPAATRGWRGQCVYIDAAHRARARVEDLIRTGTDTGLEHFPSHDYKAGQAWLDASMIACILLSWLKLIALDGDLARAEPKTLRYRILNAAARLARGGRRRCLKIAATWPWADPIVIAWQRIQAIPHPTRPARPRPAAGEALREVRADGWFRAAPGHPWPDPAVTGDPAHRPAVPAVGVDGKERKLAKAAGKKKVHLLGAITHGTGLVIGQDRVAKAGKANEVTHFKPLLAPLPLQDVVITADAMQTTRENARWLTEDKDARYLLPVLGNQQYGRWVMRNCETVLYVTSLDAGQATPADLLALVRGHWPVEHLHWLRDTV